jgi:hypothetical protein
MAQKITFSTYSQDPSNTKMLLNFTSLSGNRIDFKHTLTKDFQFYIFHLTDKIYSNVKNKTGVAEVISNPFYISERVAFTAFLSNFEFEFSGDFLKNTYHLFQLKNRKQQLTIGWEDNLDFAEKKGSEAYLIALVKDLKSVLDTQLIAANRPENCRFIAQFLFRIATKINDAFAKETAINYFFLMWKYFLLDTNNYEAHFSELKALLIQLCQENKDPKSGLSSGFFELKNQQDLLQVLGRTNVKAKVVVCLQIFLECGLFLHPDEVLRKKTEFVNKCHNKIGNSALHWQQLLEGLGHKPNLMVIQLLHLRGLFADEPFVTDIFSHVIVGKSESWYQQVRMILEQVQQFDLLSILLIEQLKNAPNRAEELHRFFKSQKRTIEQNPHLFQNILREYFLLLDFNSKESQEILAWVIGRQDEALLAIFNECFEREEDFEEPSRNKQILYNSLYNAMKESDLLKGDNIVVAGVLGVGLKSDSYDDVEQVVIYLKQVTSKMSAEQLYNFYDWIFLEIFEQVKTRNDQAQILRLIVQKYEASRGDILALYVESLFECVRLQKRPELFAEFLAIYASLDFHKIPLTAHIETELETILLDLFTRMSSRQLSNWDTFINKDAKQKDRVIIKAVWERLRTDVVVRKERTVGGKLKKLFKKVWSLGFSRK